jgi:hypothetical protein
MEETESLEGKTEEQRWMRYFLDSFKRGLSKDTYFDAAELAQRRRPGSNRWTPPYIENEPDRIPLSLM